MPTITEDSIRDRAYHLWRAEGSPSGGDEYFWHRAEQELAAENEVGITGDPGETPLHAQKKVERLQADLGEAKERIVKDAKLAGIPHQQSDPDPAPNAVAGPATGRQDVRVDDE